MLRIQAAAYESNAPDLSILGVPQAQALKFPTLNAYPKRYHPDARQIWAGMLNDPEVKATLRELEHAATAWRYVLRTFLARCKIKLIDPFAGSDTHQSAIAFLRVHRDKLVTFIDSTKLLADYVIDGKAVRKYWSKGDSVIDIESQASLKITDKEEFISRLRSSGFRRFDSENSFVFKVDPTTVVFIKVKSSTRAELRFRLVLPYELNFPKGGVLSKAEFIRFMDTKIWLPVVRAQAFTTQRRRMLF